MAVKAAVRQRMGVGLGFEDTIKAELDDGKFRILAVRDLKLEGASYIVYSKRRPLADSARISRPFCAEHGHLQLADSR